eukprot:3940238-Rhodomonas_salina.4
MFCAIWTDVMWTIDLTELGDDVRRVAVRAGKLSGCASLESLQPTRYAIKTKQNKTKQNLP